MSPKTVVLFVWLALRSIGDILAEWDAHSEQIWRSRYPEEFDNLTYGDISMNPAGTGRKNGLRAKESRWTDGIVPYVIHGPYTIEQCLIIEGAFEEYEEKTCIRFRKKTKKDKDFVSVTNDVGCHAELGRVGGEQILNIGEGPCVSRGTVMHELMHVLGFMHEQKRYDRDRYIKIMYENLKSDKIENFQKQNRSAISSFGVGYDYESITHYSPLAFSKNGEPTLMLRRDVDVNLGQREYLSKGDIKKINRMYNCSQTAIAAKPSHPRFCRLM